MNKEDNLWKRIIAARLEADELCRPYPAIYGTQTGLYRGADCLAASKRVVALLHEYQNLLANSSNAKRVPFDSTDDVIMRASN